jgi:hypothetical protein
LTAEHGIEKPAPPKRVAVVAIHGVGGPPPGRSAQRVADALLDTEPVPARPARCRALTLGPPRGGDDYPGEVYHTVVYSADVTPGAGGTAAGACQADVYEVYWADLSRAGTSVQRLPLDVLELAFFPLHLAEQAFAAERRTRPADRALRWAHVLFRLAAVLLGGVLLPLYVFLLTRPLVIALGHAPLLWQWAVVGAVVAAGGAAAVWWLIGRAARAGSGPAALAAGIGALVLAAATVAAVGADPNASGGALHPAAACAEVALGLGFLWLARRPLRRLLPDAWPAACRWWWGASLLLLAAADYAAAFWRRPEPPRGEFGGEAMSGFEASRLASFEEGWLMGYWLMVVAWGAAALAAGAGVASARRGRRDWPGGAAIWVPLGITPFAVITSVLYFGLFDLLTKNLPFHDVTRGRFEAWRDATGVNLVSYGLLALGGLTFLLPAATSVALMTFSLPGLTRLNPGGGEARRHYRTLDAALRVLPYGLGLAFLGVTVGAFLGSVAQVTALGREHVEWVQSGDLSREGSNKPQLSFVTAAGLLVLVLVRSALTSRGSGAGGGLKTAVDLVFDVLNYLRGNARVYPPEGGTGAAGAEPPGQAEQIYRRFETVLDLIGGQGYDAVLVIAHSQGAAVAFDLLTRPSPGRSGALPGKQPSEWMLVTLGNPVRQLYGAVFPTQYDRDQFERWPGGAGGSDGTPNPTRWWNLFYGTDCVGRHLIRATADGGYMAACPAGDPRHDGREGLVEHCIGVDGHTSYWGNKPFLGGVVRQCITVLLRGRATAEGQTGSPVER